MKSTPGPASPLSEADPSLLIHAARTGAARALGTHRAHLAEDAAGSALLGLMRAVAAGRAMHDPVRYAAVAGENAARDALRSERRQARLCSEFASHGAAEADAAWRLADCERVLLFTEVVRLADAEATRLRSAEMHAVARALRAIEAGCFDAPVEDAARRRLSRGSAHLSRLLRAA